jgi:hypothetical protein
MHSPFGKVVDEVWTCVMPPLRSLATDANPTKQWKPGGGRILNRVRFRFR